MKIPPPIPPVFPYAGKVTSRVCLFQDGTLLWHGVPDEDGFVKPCFPVPTRVTHIAIGDVVGNAIGKREVHIILRSNDALLIEYPNSYFGICLN